VLRYKPLGRKFCSENCANYRFPVRKRDISPQPLEATSVSHEEQVSLQGRCCMPPRQVDHHGERYSVFEGISCVRADLL